MNSVEQLDYQYVMATISNQEISDAMRRLQVDHCKLELDLQHLIAQANRLVEGEDSISNAVKLQKLRTLAANFHHELNEHAAWEEQTLFPMISLYFAKDINKLTAMEQEHVLAEQFVQAFIDALERAPVRQHEGQCMVSYLIQATNILKGHFQEEEEVLYALLDYSYMYGY